MIQDIGKLKLKNEYYNKEAYDSDTILTYYNENILLSKNPEGEISFPKVKDILEVYPKANFIYLFSIGCEKFYLYINDSEFSLEGYIRESVRSLRIKTSKAECFAAATGYHLFKWYNGNRFCSKCGHAYVHSKTERCLICLVCKKTVYPDIAPAVIAAVINGDKILLTKYAGRVYTKHALIAGFTEIGETAEETVTREVMEEVGLKVKNIRYYKSQPWGTDNNLLLGFFTELDGSDKIIRDENELASAEWVDRKDMDVDDDGISLTREMMRVFKEGNY